MATPIISNTFPVEKRIAQSGFKLSNWTYVVIPDFPADIARANGGTVKVKGFVDHYELKQHRLLPMQGNSMMLPLKSAIRKAIKKEAGDQVHVVLFLDDSILEIPEELLTCLLDAPAAHDFFMRLSESNQKYYIDWILAAKTLDTKVERIARTIERLEQQQRFYDWKR